MEKLGKERSLYRSYISNVNGQSRINQGAEKVKEDMGRMGAIPALDSGAQMTHPRHLRHSSTIRWYKKNPVFLSFPLQAEARESIELLQ
jgi:hypothetical protein